MKLAIAAVTVLVVSLLGVSFSLAGDLPVMPDFNLLFDGNDVGLMTEDGQIQSRTAQQRAHQFRTQTEGPGPYFVDEDGDGICDNCSGGLNAAMTQTQTEAQNGFQASGPHGPGPFYVDADGNGALNAYRHAKQESEQSGFQAAGPHGPGPNFVDEDGDGVCDNCAGNMNAIQQSTQAQNGFQMAGPNGPGPNFVDEDGDGVCDNCTGNASMHQHSNGYQEGGPHGQGPNAMMGDGNCDGPQNQHGNPATGGGGSSAGSNGN